MLRLIGSEAAPARVKLGDLPKKDRSEQNLTTIRIVSQPNEDVAGPRSVQRRRLRTHHTRRLTPPGLAGA